MANGKQPQEGEQKPGVGVDAFGNQTVDPTKNVLDLVEASNLRQDDLRQLNDRRIDAEIRVLAAQIQGLKEIATIRSTYEEKLSNAEAKRIDAIRAVDVNAVAVANQKSADQATVLANQVVASADALRGLVATTAQAQSQASQQAMTALSDRITTIEKAQYEEKGKQGVVDPMQAEMVAEMRRVSAVIAGTAGKSTGRDDMWKYLTAGVALLYILLKLAGKM
jgi:hypothetical protein